ncbi:MAG: hypothetical protein GWP91_02235 [Rhodobacterales bacterium]|nr:hypothetical protein [Rhodobacterales bacterium]
MSDSDLTLSTRCPHYAECHYYKARREAAAADLLVVNHALLLSDRFLVDRLGRGILPKVARVVLDEAHHLEDATTGAGAQRLTAMAVRRAVLPLLDRKRRRGGLSRMIERHGGKNSQLAPPQRSELMDRATVCQGNLSALAGSIQHVSEQIAQRCLKSDGAPLRITETYAQSQDWQMGVSPDIAHVAHELRSASEDLDAIEQLFADIHLKEVDSQPLLDVRRARRRLAGQADVAQTFLDSGPEAVRWIEPARSRRGDKGAAICSAPIDVGSALRRVLWNPLPGTVSTSATLSVNGRFTYWQRRHGLVDPKTEHYASPFDHASQAILGLPRDIPPPNRPEYHEEISKVMVDAIRISDGGAFILCTSYNAVRIFAAALRKAEPSRPFVVQGESGRTQLLQRFRENDRAVLVGTDSFWEGVSVRGRGLRLVMIPRLPFRVPTDPLRQARHEQAKGKGLDPFLAYSLPEAVIKLRQGYGRLIRSKNDIGAVLILDRRVHDRRYGRVMLNSLPPARRVVGPWSVVMQSLRALYSPSHEEIDD